MKFFTYKLLDEPLDNPKQKFRVKFFFAILSTAVSSVKERFAQLKETTKLFCFK